MDNNKVAANEVIARVNEHNKHCQKVEEMWIAEYDSPTGVSQCVDTMREANYRTGIEYCCWMRHYGLDAVVDRCMGYVVPASEVDMDEEIDEGEKRYYTFEWVED